ncbi:hypothetical protein BHM03_00007176, partial [Ensete ventricosum]
IIGDGALDPSGVPRTMSNVPPCLSDEEFESVRRLMGILSLSWAIRDMTDAWLVEAGLSPAPRGIVNFQLYVMAEESAQLGLAQVRKIVHVGRRVGDARGGHTWFLNGGRILDRLGRTPSEAWDIRDSIAPNDAAGRHRLSRSQSMGGSIVS